MNDETKVFCGAHCLKTHGEALILGTSCLIVTGKRSAKISGALRDVTGVLTAHGIPYTVYDGVTENPLLSQTREAGRQGRDFGADFVVGIGGGSPLDAAKGAAVFACDPDLPEAVLYDSTAPKACLPLAALPLTAGTGSEVNRYSVLTVGERKLSFSTPDTLPRVAFLDPRYLRTLGREGTVSTALDAFCHCLESYLSPKSTPASEADARKGGRLLWELLTTKEFRPDGADAAGLTEDERLATLEAGACGGRAIKVTGTGFPHPLGYGLSLRHGIPHGRACGAFTGVFVERNEETEEGRRRLMAFADALGTSPAMIAAVIPALADVNLSLSDAEITTMVSLVSGAKNYQNAPAVIGDGEAEAILTEMFGV